MAWATDAQVAANLGVTVDALVTSKTAVAISWAQAQRPDLDSRQDPPAHVTEAVVIYASLLYRQKASPQGYATYSSEGGGLDVGDAMSNVYRLLGSRRPVAR
jgi:hypothetical protein